MINPSLHNTLHLLLFSSLQHYRASKKTKMASISSLMAPPNLLHLHGLKPISVRQSPSFQILRPTHFQITHKFASAPLFLIPGHSKTRPFAVAEGTSVSEADRKLYIGNIPRGMTTEQLKKIVEEHGSVETAEVMRDKHSGRSRRFAFVTMKTVEDANAAVEKLNGTEIEGREIKVNVTEKPMTPVDLSAIPEEEFVDSPHKVYVGNLANTVTSESLKKLFSEKGNVLGARVARNPGTSKSAGFGFVTFSSEEDVEAAITTFKNAPLEGQKIRVNKA